MNPKFEYFSPVAFSLHQNAKQLGYSVNLTQVTHHDQRRQFMHVTLTGRFKTFELTYSRRKDTEDTYKLNKIEQRYPEIKEIRTHRTLRNYL